MESVRKLIFKELEKEMEYDSFDTLEVAAINFIGYKNKKNIGKLLISLETLDVDLYELKRRIEEILYRNSIECRSIYIEL